MHNNATIYERSVASSGSYVMTIPMRTCLPSCAAPNCPLLAGYLLLFPLSSMAITALIITCCLSWKYGVRDSMGAVDDLFSVRVRATFSCAAEHKL